WAAGLPVPGAPPNFNPARVINVSLGSEATCPAAYQDAINAALMANASVIVAAGNETTNAALSSPANCNGVITVAATRRSGDLASYSNFGASVEVAAPGGEGPEGEIDAIGSTNNAGLFTPSDYIEWSLFGTSFAAPQVAGIASLMLSVNPALTPAWITYLIQITARPFAPGTLCAFYYPVCGAGIIDAGAAVAAARRQASTGPQPGWWWNPDQSGRGFTIEVRGSNLFMAGYLYADNGRATWLVSAGAMTNASSYSGPLMAFGGGQTLTGAYKSNTLTNPNVGTITLQFSNARHGTLTWPGGTMPIERFPFGSGTASFQPESGWWWNEAESGRGFAIEVQGNNLFMAGYMYDSSGNPIWYVSSGGMTFSNLYQGSWLQFANGQTLTGTYQPPSQPPANVGALTLQFTSATTAILTLPNGRQIPLTRFLF
ncbi:MAG TPA: S8 family serine peptidase, partial [Gammaproteobacteria bacterium]|nr:S8 family serine peptidase [Gammaproteobacteria bacterium]